MEDDKQSGGVNADVGGDLNAQNIVGRDSIQNTTTQTTTNIEGGPVARYSVIGIVIVAVIAIASIAIIVLVLSRGILSPKPTSEAAPTPTIASSFTSAPPTATPPPISTTSPTPTESTITPSPPTPTPAYFRSGCIVTGKGKWAATTAVPIGEGDLCLSLRDIGFEAQDNGLEINMTNPALTCPDQKCDLQKGIYIPLDEIVAITFTLKVKGFWSPNSRSNLAFAIVDAKGGVSYGDSAVYLYYYAAKQSGTSTLAKIVANNVILNTCRKIPALVFDTLQNPISSQVAFSLKNGELVIRVDGETICTAHPSLDFDQPVFYVGYDLFEASNLVAIILDFSVQTK